MARLLLAASLLLPAWSVPARQADPPHAPADPLAASLAGEFALQDGQLEEAARGYLVAARAANDPVLAERAQFDHRLYWVVWSNPHYTGWAAHSASTPEAFLVYQATQAAIAAARGAAVTSTVPWTVELFEYAPDGLSRPFTSGP